MNYLSLFVALLSFTAWVIGVFAFDVSGFYHLLLIPATVILYMSMMERSLELKKISQAQRVLTTTS